jgi:hypothetical protein
MAGILWILSTSASATAEPIRVSFSGTLSVPEWAVDPVRLSFGTTLRDGDPFVGSVTYDSEALPRGFTYPSGPIILNLGGTDHVFNISPSFFVPNVSLAPDVVNTNVQFSAWTSLPPPYRRGFIELVVAFPSSVLSRDTVPPASIFSSRRSAAVQLCVPTCDDEGPGSFGLGWEIESIEAASAVPEPGTFALATSAAVIAWRTTRRKRSVAG